jgi:mannose-6-phosphate isomerase-like protein (cupin superfamily)
MDATVVRPGDGRVYERPVSHALVTVKLSRDGWTVFETHRKAGEDARSGLHAHPEFDETFYVVSGAWEFELGEEVISADAGTVVHVPRGLFHRFGSTGHTEGKLVGFAMPGGIEDWLAGTATSERRNDP